MHYSRTSYKGNSLMNLAKSSKRNLATSLTLIFIALLVWISLLGQSKSVQPAPLTATETPFAPFLLDIPEKALWKNYLNVSAETSAGTTCRLTYISPKGVTHQMDTTANESGLCEWRWKISEEEGKGSGRLIFTINGTSETHFIEIRSSF